MQLFVWFIFHNCEKRER
uniref:Uncharacterized protein n=1 Tax=Anopheles dirus TaxID=7168 RepID=A0A182NYD8_9DIPT